MIAPACTVETIAGVCHGKLLANGNAGLIIKEILIDSRRLIHPENCMFVALVTSRNDGHRYIQELYEKGIRCFMVAGLPETPADYTDQNQSHQQHHEPCMAEAVRNDESKIQHLPGAAFIMVGDTLKALQMLGAYHRQQFEIPVLGITGSNGKTIVKEWLFQLLSPDFRVIRSPRSYNSQVGVPLSVWKMESGHQLAIFEAGISKPGEMEHLEPVIRPDIGIFTNIGHAHDEHFTGLHQKTTEKLKLFTRSKVIVYRSDYGIITQCLREDEKFRHMVTFTWGSLETDDLQITAMERKEGCTVIAALLHPKKNILQNNSLTHKPGEERLSITIPFTDDASVENSIHCLAASVALSHWMAGLERQEVPVGRPQSFTDLISRFPSLIPVAFRLELKEAINHCSLINDYYNSDINSLGIALDFLNQQGQHQKKSVILSDILQTGRDKHELYREIASMLATRNITKVIGIGRDMVKHAGAFAMPGRFFATTDDFLREYPMSSFQHETILLKGARLFEFEKISRQLQQKAHETVMEVNLDALIHNLNHYRSLLKPGTRIMAMVKAFSYGSGSYEIANVLQFHHVDYLAVAYADEGVELRKAGIHLPVMVMSPEESSLDLLLKYNLEPEIYNFRILKLLLGAIDRNQTAVQDEVRIHIKIDTGMHRLGFLPSEVPGLITLLQQHHGLRVQSVFSHLAASEDPAEINFTTSQVESFTAACDQMSRSLQYPFLRHILNSAGISRFADAQFDMVRLGIGLYGVGSDAGEQSMLRNVSTLKSVVTQIKHIPAGETVGYNRRGLTNRDTTIAIVPVGYADGLNRKLGNGAGRMYIYGKPAPIIGNICMDLTMLDVTDMEGTGTSAKAANDSQLAEPGATAASQTGVREGDEVIIFDDNHPVNEIAQQLGTIPYEILTGISRRVKRIYFYE